MVSIMIHNKGTTGRLAVFSVWLLIVLLGTSSCCSLFPGRCVLNFEPNRNHLHQSAIQVEAALSDTLFSVEELRPLARHCGIPSEYNLYREALKLFVSLSATNVSGTDLLVREEALRSGGQSTDHRENALDVVVLVGAEGDTAAFAEPPQYGHPALWPRSPEFFSIMRAGQTRFLSDSIEALCANNYVPLRSGRYWALVKYQNFAWKESRVPYWTGEIWSDTLWFRVVD